MSLEEAKGLRLVFDGDCPLCQGIVKALARMDLVAPERTRAFQDYEGEISERLWDAGIRNEIAVLDEASGTIRSGVDGLIWILRESWARPFVALAALPPFLWLARLVYRLVAYNRHLLAPKDPARIRCACDADFHLGYRLGLLVPAIVFAIATMFAFLASFEHAEGSWSAARVLPTLLAMAGVLVVVVVPALRLPRERAFDWFGHLAVVAAEAAMALLPVVVLSSWLRGAVLQAVQAGAILVALLVFAWSLAARMRAMRVVLAAPAPGQPSGAPPPGGRLPSP